VRIKGGGDLRRWLNGIVDEELRRKYAVAIASRAALRVLPVIEIWLSKDEEEAISIVLPVFRAIAASRLAAVGSRRHAEIIFAAAFAAKAVAVSTSAAGRTVDAAVTTAFAAANAATATDIHNAARDAAVGVSAASLVVTNVWKVIERDVGILVEVGEGAISILMHHEPLWPEGLSNLMQGFWESMKFRLLAREGEHWDVWTNWYEARINPSKRIPCYSPYYTPPIPELERKRVLLPQKLWEQGPKAANAEIKRLIDESGCAEKISRKQPDKKTGASQKAEESIPENSLADTKFVSDVPDERVDYLARADLAMVLAGQINRVWDEQQKNSTDPNRPNPGFVVHLDARWGEGKTTFAAMVAAVLNLRRHGKDNESEWLKQLPLNDEEKWPLKWRRPWRIVWYNAWQHEHLNPPWWGFYQTIYSQLKEQAMEDAGERSFDIVFPASSYFPDPLMRRIHKWRLVLHDLWGRMRLWGLVWLSVIFTLFFVAFFYFTGWENDKIWKALLAIWAIAFGISRYLRPDMDGKWHFGISDPYNRMRAHFRKLLEIVKQPVLVIVDDLDRCKPEHVVDLLRGMQTILNSPRIVFMLLGDRDWIEKAFAVTHADMEGLNVGPEHEFGGRFVEKAIQFSLSLPEISEQQRKVYLRQVLGLAPDAEGEMPKAEAVNERIREVLQEADAIKDFAKREKTVARKVREIAEKLPRETREALKRNVAREMSYRAVADETVEKELRHMLEGLAEVLPANPRQVKRIVNTLSVVQEVARLNDPARYPGSDDWRKLARWVVLMIEWPRSWVTLSRHPERAGELNLENRKLGDSPPLDEAVVRLVRGTGLPPEWRKPITEEDIREWLAPAMPPTSGKPWDLEKG